MNQAINLKGEIKLREGLNREFDSFMKALKGGFSAESEADVDALALLLAETIEARKSIEREEKALKAELRRHFKGNVLDLPHVVALLEEVTRTDMDKERMAADLGTEFLEKYAKRTTYEKMMVKRKVSNE